MMVNRKRHLLPVAMVLAMSACSGKTFKPFALQPGAEPTSLSVDASQRFMLVKQRAGDPGNVIVCTEPSPDAAMAVAGQIGANGTLPNGLTAGLDAKRGEALASLGLRTPAIQLVRDLWFRACEGYMNGVHSEAQLNAFASSVGGLIAALQAMDSLAGAPSAPPVALVASSDGAAAGSAAEIGTPATTSRADGSAEAIVEIYRQYLAFSKAAAEAARAK